MCIEGPKRDRWRTFAGLMRQMHTVALIGLLRFIEQGKTNKRSNKLYIDSNRKVAAVAGG